MLVSYGKESSGGFSFVQVVIDDLRHPNHTEVLFHSTKAERKILYALLDDLKKDNMKPKTKTKNAKTIKLQCQRPERGYHFTFTMIW